jgi:NAD(P)-dependent dehydrogenase (short-subunit alcohol dehydrogenase family)
VPEANMYTATKHGLKGLSEYLRIELMPYNIPVTFACPPFVETPMLDEGDESQKNPRNPRNPRSPRIHWNHWNPRNPRIPRNAIYTHTLLHRNQVLCPATMLFD